MKPQTRPNNPCFSSGPCAKRPGWSVSVLKDSSAGRSHRAKEAKAKLAEVIERSHRLLGIPEPPARCHKAYASCSTSPWQPCAGHSC